MSRLSAVLRGVEGNGLMFWCPGCDGAHVIYHGEGHGPRWGWNGNADRPTFTPSILIQWDQWVPPATTQEMAARINSGEIVQTKEQRICHSFVTDGRIRFLSDCTHPLAGQTVDLPEFDNT